MRLTGKEYIEIAHDVLAAKVFEKASPLEQQRLEAERLIRDGYRQFEARGKMLDRSDLDLIRPVADRLDLRPEEWSYLRQSRHRLRNRRILMVSGLALLLLLGGILWVTHSQKVVQERMAEANRWIYLANHYAQQNQLDSALLFAEAAYDQTLPNPLPAAQRILASAFHKGLEGIPLRQRRHLLPGIPQSLVLLPGGQAALLAYEQGNLGLLDLPGGRSETLFRGTAPFQLTIHPDGDEALVADTDTLLHFDLNSRDMLDRFTLGGMLVGQGFWIAGGGVLVATEDSLYFRSVQPGKASWRRPLFEEGTFATALAVAPGAAYAAVLCGNGTIYRFGPDQELWDSLSAPADLTGLAILEGDRLFMLSDTAAWFVDAPGASMRRVGLPPVPDHLFGPDLAVDDLAGASAVYLNLGQALVRLPADGSGLDTVGTFEQVYTDLRYAPERQAAIDRRAHHLISLESNRGRRLMSLPPFGLMDYEEANRSLVMVQDSVLTLWQFTYGPFQERRSVESLFFPTPQSTTLLAVEQGEVYRKGKASEDVWQKVVFPEPIAHAVVSPTDLSLLGLSRDGSLYRVVDNVAREVLQLQPGGSWHSMHFEDSTLVVRRQDTGEVHAWKPGQASVQTFSYPGKVQDVEAGAGLIAISGSEDDVVLWRSNGDSLTRLAGHEQDVLDVDLSPDGTLLATASGDRAARLWNTQGDMLHELLGHTGYVNAVVFSPDGQSLVTASSDGRLMSWSTATGELRHLFLGHQGQVRGASFSPDGRQLLSWSEDGTARLWNLRGEPLAVYGYPERHEGIERAEFSSDGNRIITHSEDDRLRVWLTPSEVGRWVKANYARH